MEFSEALSWLEFLPLVLAGVALLALVVVMFRAVGRLGDSYPSGAIDAVVAGIVNGISEVIAGLQQEATKTESVIDDEILERIAELVIRLQEERNAPQEPPAQG